MPHEIARVGPDKQAVGLKPGRDAWCWCSWGVKCLLSRISCYITAISSSLDGDGNVNQALTYAEAIQCHRVSV